MRFMRVSSGAVHGDRREAGGTKQGAGGFAGAGKG
jgi:hypothetical protein